MADINQVITLGIGTPADITHFILVGLNTNLVIQTYIDGPQLIVEVARAKGLNIEIARSRSSVVEIARAHAIVAGLGGVPQ